MLAVYMLPTNLQLLDRFKAVRSVLKPSGRFQSRPCQHTYTCMHIDFIVTHTTPGLRTCAVCVTYTTQLAAEMHVVVYRECLFFYVCSSKATSITED